MTDTELLPIAADLDWEDQLAELLAMLSDIQGELLQLLQEKRQLLLDPDPRGLDEIAPRERELIERLQHCQEERGKLLARAAERGLPAASLRELGKALPAERDELRVRIKDARARARLLQHQGLTNWVLAQRTLIHLSQILEIIATGGRGETTYGKGERRAASGSLVDRAA